MNKQERIKKLADNIKQLPFYNEILFAEVTIMPPKKFIEQDIVDYMAENKDCVVLMFASNKRFGGGVRSGAIAQEEDIVLNTNLCSLIKDDKLDALYPLGDKIIEFDNVVVINDSSDTTRFNTVVLAAATNTNANYKQSDMKTKIDNLVRYLAINHAERTIALGAWGCGVFGNSVAEVAKLFAVAIKAQENLMFKPMNVEFVIKGRETLDTFKHNFKKHYGN